VDGTTILVVDDEPQIRRLIRNALTAEGATVLEAATAAEGIDCAASGRPDLLILDLGLPDKPGMSVCLEVRKWTMAPIIVLSARHSDSDKVALLDAGADDYVSKPFSTPELLARVRAQLRRNAVADTAAGAPLEVAGLCIDAGRRTISRDGREIHLTPTEWDLLRAFLRHAGRTLTHQQIFREVWRAPAGDAQGYLRVHVANLRRKIEPDPVRPRLIITEPGVGYRFRALE
jgi:two-component system, OmpR family, KDP operon response regulator KdpE